MDERGIRYSWLYRQFGLEPWQFTRIEGGKSKPPEGFYERAAELLDEPVEKVRPEAAA